MPSFLTLVLPTHPPWSAQGYTSLIPKREGEASKSHAGLDSSSSKGKHKHKHKKVLNAGSPTPTAHGRPSDITYPRPTYRPTSRLTPPFSPNKELPPCGWVDRESTHRRRDRRNEPRVAKARATAPRVCRSHGLLNPASAGRIEEGGRGVSHASLLSKTCPYYIRFASKPLSRLPFNPRTYQRTLRILQPERTSANACVRPA
jgi:hypothetical protein